MAMAAPSSSNCSSKFNGINDLLDDSLMEIFCCLPCKFVFRCKCVSKRWSSLISDPKFHCLYLSRQHSLFEKLQRQGEDLDHQSFILTPYNAFVIIPKVPALQFGSPENELSLSFLAPNIETADVNPQLRSVLKLVFACSNGLLLCGQPRPEYKCRFYICNPLTKDCLELPPAPTACDKAGVIVCFTCDPYYRVEAETVSVCSQQMFKVVRIPAFCDTRFAFDVEIFSSETGQWTELVVSCPKGFACGFFLTAQSIAFNGKLYFSSGRKLLVYDPFNNQKIAGVIDFPSDFGEAYRGCLGVSNGSLRICEFPCPRHPLANVSPYTGRIWELENSHCETGEVTWRLLREFCLPEIIGPIFEELEAIQRGYICGYSRVLAFHPHDGVTVFLEFADHVLSCNLLTQRFKATRYGGNPLGFYPVTAVVLPWWPTPIPSLPYPVDHSV